MKEVSKKIKAEIPNGVMLNAYPDSCGGSLAETVKMLKRDEFSNVFSIFYILPSMFRSDLDRGFSIVSYDLDTDMARTEDLEDLRKMNISLKLDFVLNHLSVRSPQFQDILEKGEKSEYYDCFIDWNKFWEGKGVTGEDGFIIPHEKYMKVLFMRKPGLPIFKLPFPDGSYRFYWNTFYQKTEIKIPDVKDIISIPEMNSESVIKIIKLIIDGNEMGISPSEMDFTGLEKYKKNIVMLLEKKFVSYFGQMDLDAGSEKVWKFYEGTIEKLYSYGAKIVRLDAFAYLDKRHGYSNFFNEPATWDHLARIKKFADRYEITLLPEIHSRYEDGTHRQLAEKGYMFYDFFFPGLIIDAVENGSGKYLKKWIDEIVNNAYMTVNMLGCHDGIPVLDLKGLLNDEKIEELIKLIKNRGGMVKDLYGPDGKIISYYQVNATFFSALEENSRKMLFARAIQMFMPGIPQVWYLDLFNGKNDYAAAVHGHKEINRTNLSSDKIANIIGSELFLDQIKMIKFRNSYPAFLLGSEFTCDISEDSVIRMKWEKDGYKAILEADFKSLEFEILHENNGVETRLF